MPGPQPRPIVLTHAACRPRHLTRRQSTLSDWCAGRGSSWRPLRAPTMSRSPKAPGIDRDTVRTWRMVGLRLRALEAAEKEA